MSDVDLLAEVRQYRHAEALAADALHDADDAQDEEPEYDDAAEGTYGASDRGRCELGDHPVNHPADELTDGDAHAVLGVPLHLGILSSREQWDEEQDPDGGQHDHQRSVAATSGSGVTGTATTGRRRGRRYIRTASWRRRDSRR